MNNYNSNINYKFIKRKFIENDKRCYWCGNIKKSKTGLCDKCHRFH